jgi:hypothetical protein
MPYLCTNDVNYPHAQEIEVDKTLCIGLLELGFVGHVRGL